jgi:hypothetical protein
MRSPLTRVVPVVATATLVLTANAQPPQSPLVRTGGSDGLVGTIYDARTYGTQTVDGSVTRSFGIGTEAWNIGDRPIEWVAGTNQHAVIVGNLYKAVGTRFEQIGMSWAKHVVVAANLPFDPSYGPCISSGFTRLGVNCGDVYSSLQNGGQNGLGPRYDINPTTGAFSYPFAQLVPPVAPGDTTARRLIVRESDLPPGVSCYADAGLYAPDDSAWGNGRNNFSARRLAPFSNLGGSEQPLIFDGPSYRTSALEYWAWATPGISLGRADLVEQDGTVVDRWDAYTNGDTSTPLLPESQWVTVARHLTTRFVAAGAATDNGNGTWTYDYAVLNMNSQRAGAELALHLPVNATVSLTAFHAPEYHSGDRVRNAPWPVTNAAGKLAWRVDPASEAVTLPSVGQVTLAPNALMFATVYTFSATVNKAPTAGAAHLGLWRAPADALGYQGASVALPGLPVPAFCPADVGSEGGTPGPDGALNNNDLIAFIDAFFNGDRFRADVGSQGALPGPDNNLDNNDFIVFIDAFFTGCGD